MRRILSLALLIFFIPAAWGSQGFADISGHWGEEYMSKMISAGVVIGDGRGSAMPDRAVTHREAAIMLARVFGTGAEDGGDAPNSAMTRFDAFSVIREAFRLPSAPAGFTSRFPDMADIPGLTSILAMEYAGMISGKNGMLALTDTVTRAEFTALLSRCAGIFIDSDTDFEGAEIARAVIRSPGLTVKNLTAESIIAAQGVGNGGVTFIGADLGLLNILGGGRTDLIDTYVTMLILDASGGVRVLVGEGSLVESAVIYSKDSVLVIEGEVITVIDRT